MRTRRSPRIVALLLSILVCADIAFDATCDPLRPAASSPSSHSVRAFRDDGCTGDECAATCVPDCFCCSSNEGVAGALPASPLVPVAEAPDAPPVSIAAVTRPVPELPPLALS